MRRRISIRVAIALALAATCGLAPRAHADLPIDLEVAAMADAPLGAMQQWAPILGEIGLANFRLRGSHEGDKPALTATTVGSAKRYRVVGVLNRQDKLLLPGAAFDQGDAAALKKFFQDLPAHEEEKGIERGPFELTRPDFDKAFAALAAPVASATIPPQQLVGKLETTEKIPLEFDGDVRERLESAQPLASEMKGLSLGTVLAAALRQNDLQLAPEHPRGGRLAFRISPFDPMGESWPVGWKPTQLPSQVVPQMHKYTMIEIEGYTLAKALDALGSYSGIPLVRDERILATLPGDRFGDNVKLPRRKTTLRYAIDAVLSQRGLAGELRVDEAGHPFYWITQWGPESPKAR